MRIGIDQDGCIGCGLCVAICNTVFEIDEEGKAFSSKVVVPGERENEVFDAKESCPCDAIVIR